MTPTRRRLWDPASPQADQSISSFLSASKDETILLSSAGDVLTCRCRDSAISSALSQERWTGYDWGAELAALCCKGEFDDLSAHLQETGFCGMTNRAMPRHRKHQSVPAGLLGGSPAEVAPLTPLQMMMETPPRSKASADAIARNKEMAFRGSTSSETVDSDDGSIVPIKSFDYSHFADGGNDMLPESIERKKQAERAKQRCSPSSRDLDKVQPAMHANGLIHGVPTFLSSFLNVKITQVSAHPLGSHVLLVSSAGILYSYGQNNYGQLGIGVKTQVKDANKGYIMTPTIVTPLLENGGKAVRAAAGVDHSLVLVMTEERRLVKSTSTSGHPHQQLLNGNTQTTETVMYHQVYGFGRNDSMKLGLVSPKTAPLDDFNCVSLPKRVALRCKVRPPPPGDDTSNMPPMGVFALEASETHSAALVRRASGDVEVFMWGRALNGALGFGSTQTVGLGETRPLPRVVPVPTVVDGLSKTINVDTQSSALHVGVEPEHVVSVSLGRSSSFVVTSLGRCLSFGTSLDGMLGHGPSMLESDSPREIPFPDGVRIRAVSAGATHVLALTDDGHVYTWGRRVPSDGNGDVVDHPITEDQLAAMDVDWSPRHIFVDDVAGEEEKKDEFGAAKVFQVCAGFDSSVLLTESGHVLSYGKRSGRLGVGETRADVQSPQPMFGGLRLWQEHGLRKQNRMVLPQTPNRAEFKRGFSTSAI